MGLEDVARVRCIAVKADEYERTLDAKMAKLSHKNFA